MPLSKVQLSETGRRTLIHNGAMKVAQRGSQNNGTGLSGTACDRFRLAMSGGAAVTTTQDANVPNLSNGFRNSLKVDCTTADTSVAAGDYVILYQRIEGQDLQHLLYGTTSHKKVTAQFWVKSPKTGTHVVELYHLDAGYFNSQQYTISSADTWEKKTVTFVGYPTSSFDNDANGSLQLAWWLLGGSTYSGGTHNSNTWHNTQANRAVGQVNVLDNTANNFYLTGVQMEVSDSASDFEHRSFAEELSLCKRYYEEISPANSTYYGVGSVSSGGSSPTVIGQVSWDLEKRATPAVTYAGTPGSHFIVTRAGSSNAGMGTITFGNINKRNCYIQSASSPSAMTTGYSTLLSIIGSGKIFINAEI